MTAKGGWKFRQSFVAQDAPDPAAHRLQLGKEGTQADLVLVDQMIPGNVIRIALGNERDDIGVSRGLDGVSWDRVEWRASRSPTKSAEVSCSRPSVGAVLRLVKIKEACISSTLRSLTAAAGVGLAMSSTGGVRYGSTLLGSSRGGANPAPWVRSLQVLVSTSRPKWPKEDSTQDILLDEV